MQFARTANKGANMFDKVKILNACLSLLKSFRGKLSIGDCWKVTKIAWKVWKWFKKAYKDKKITWDEWKDLIATITTGIGESTLSKMLEKSGKATVIGDSSVVKALDRIYYNNQLWNNKQSTKGVSAMENEVKTTGSNVYEAILESIKWGADAGKDHILTVGELHGGAGVIIEKLGLKDKPVIRW